MGRRVADFGRDDGESAKVNIGTRYGDSGI